MIKFYVSKLSKKQNKESWMTGISDATLALVFGSISFTIFLVAFVYAMIPATPKIQQTPMSGKMGTFVPASQMACKLMDYLVLDGALVTFPKTVVLEVDGKLHQFEGLSGVVHLYINAPSQIEIMSYRSCLEISPQ